MQTLIAYKDVDIERQEQKLFSSIDLNVVEGEFVYLIGKVGSGKSSLLKTFYAELPIARGKSAKVFDYDLLHLKRSKIAYLRRQLGIIFQDFQLLTDRTVEENLEFVLRATGWNSKSEIKARIEKVLEQVGMENRGYRMPNTLSGGEQQRIVIARALLNSPKIILADEPTGNLDPETAHNIVQLLYDICHTQNTTVIMSTHNLRFLEVFPGRVLKVDNQSLIDETKKKAELLPLTAEEKEAEDNLLMGIAQVPMEEKDTVEELQMEEDQTSEQQEKEQVGGQKSDADTDTLAEQTSETPIDQETEMEEETCNKEKDEDVSVCKTDGCEEEFVNETPASAEEPKEEGGSIETTSIEEIVEEGVLNQGIVAGTASTEDVVDEGVSDESIATETASIVEVVEEIVDEAEISEEECKNENISEGGTSPEPTSEKELKTGEGQEVEKVKTSMADIDWDAIQRAFEEKKRREFQSQLSQMVDKINSGQVTDTEVSHE